MIAAAVFFVLLLATIAIFAFPRFSPIPYFPSNKKDMPLILSALRLRKKQVVIDLGAGDGIIIFRAADIAYHKALDVHFFAVEINPVLLLILYIRKAFHPYRDHIHIVKKDMFTMDYSQMLSPFKHNHAITFYLYISPWFIDKTVNNIERQLSSFNVISYYYQIACLPKYRKTVRKGVHTLYSYHKQK